MVRIAPNRIFVSGLLYGRKSRRDASGTTAAPSRTFRIIRKPFKPTVRNVQYFEMWRFCRT